MQSTLRAMGQDLLYLWNSILRPIGRVFWWPFVDIWEKFNSILEAFPTTTPLWLTASALAVELPAIAMLFKDPINWGLEAGLIGIFTILTVIRRL